MVKFAGNVSELSNNLNKIGLLQIQQMNEKKCQTYEMDFNNVSLCYLTLDIKTESYGCHLYKTYLILNRALTA